MVKHILKRTFHFGFNSGEEGYHIGASIEFGREDVGDSDEPNVLVRIWIDNSQPLIGDDDGEDGGVIRLVESRMRRQRVTEV